MPTPFTILLVDDEINILRSLHRLLRPEGYRILTAESGAAALSLMSSEPVDLVISDMRMPEMDGAVFLAKVRQEWPDTIRLLLTGHADMAQTVAAINQGEIYRFIAKPWNDQELQIIVRQALEQLYLRRENQRLLKLTAEQNEALKEANNTLEHKVAERTAELSQLISFLELTQEELKTSFRTSVQVFSSIIEMRFADWTGHSQRVVSLAERLAKYADLKPEEIEAVRNAAMLHDIGKVALPDSLLNKSFANHNRQERAEFMEHPAIGQMVLLPIPELNLAGIYIRGQHENVDGSGFPDHLKLNEIPIGARILAIVVDYDELQLGLFMAREFTAEHALLYIKENRDIRYDSTLVQLFIQSLEAEHHKYKEVTLTSSQLKPGMVLTRDLYSAGHFLLLAKGRKLDPSIIKHICRFEQTDGKAVTVYIRQDIN
ncbi:HD domain-containing phosphohydrolase [uncultured Tolumonas sp.]|uniref:HD domain-containing phosphohydrolase n=1 Tax=uncultured Tolumonas sp. TaxID=263765 RepID=UPI00292D00A0|nr:HD domain-containing phosphohydrolase [uncultured Tolumonas sp.]